jgi:hypothetical protein
MTRAALAPMILFVFAGCAGSREGAGPLPPPAGSVGPPLAGVRIEAGAEEAELVGRLAEYSRSAAARVETFFGAPFTRSVRVRVFPSRVEMEAYMREAWGLEEAACWMVAGAEEEGLILLSPRVWREEACDHDPTDQDHVRDLVAHELVHVYHMLRNPTHELEGVEGLDWFVEGLATYASGQYERSHAERAREAVAAGAAPERLADAWTGPYRYGVSGSLVAYVESRIGRAGVINLLEATRLEEVLTAVGMSEPEFLAGWAAWVRG